MYFCKLRKRAASCATEYLYMASKSAVTKATENFSITLSGVEKSLFLSLQDEKSRSPMKTKAIILIFLIIMQLLKSVQKYKKNVSLQLEIKINIK